MFYLACDTLCGKPRTTLLCAFFFQLVAFLTGAIGLAIFYIYYLDYTDDRIFHIGYGGYVYIAGLAGTTVGFIFIISELVVESNKSD